MVPNNTISGPSSARQRNAILMVFRWHADDDLTLNSGLVALSFKGIRTSFAKKPYIFVIFQGGPDPSGSAHGMDLYWYCLHTVVCYSPIIERKWTASRN